MEELKVVNRKIITRTVWVLSLVSLFTDIASESLYPVMPVYLKEIGFSVLLIGVLEGFAEATAGLSKSYFGRLSDLSGTRLPFVRFGYLLSAISKPMMAVFTFPVWIFFSRTIDRFGKGIRTGARDALLSDEATPETKGRVFGFHRAMDTLGAVIGPSLALLYLYLFPGSYKSLFYLAFIPGLLAIGFTFLIREQKKEQKKIVELKSASIFSFAQYWKRSPSSYKKLVIGLLAFTLINSSDLFLLLKVKESGLSDTAVIGVYVFYNLIYALAAYPLGRLGDRIGFKRTLLIGLCLFATVYAGMAVSHQLYQFIVLFFLYGVYAAATESVAKAWISNICNKRDTATAIGTYTGFQSIFTMMASSLAGGIWLMFGAPATFMFSAIATVLTIAYMIVVVPSRSHHQV
jgi:MFS family permease